MSGVSNRRRKHASDIKSGTAATERKRIVGAVLHGVERPGSHREGIARAQKLSRLARKHQPGTSVPHDGGITSGSRGPQRPRFAVLRLADKTVGLTPTSTAHSRTHCSTRPSGSIA